MEFLFNYLERWYLHIRWMCNVIFLTERMRVTLSEIKTLTKVVPYGNVSRVFFNVLCSNTAGDLAGISVRMAQCALNINTSEWVQSVPFNAPSFYFSSTCKQTCPLPTELHLPSCKCIAVIDEKSTVVSSSVFDELSAAPQHQHWLCKLTKTARLICMIRSKLVTAAW